MLFLQVDDLAIDGAINGDSPVVLAELARGQVSLSPADAARQLSKLWAQEPGLLKQVFPEFSDQSFFQQVVPVPPNRFRPIAKVGDQVFEHSQNIWLGKIITLNEQLHQLLAPLEDVEPGVGLSYNDRVMRVWDEISLTVACISDSSRSKEGGR